MQLLQSYLLFVDGPLVYIKHKTTLSSPCDTSLKAFTDDITLQVRTIYKYPPIISETLTYDKEWTICWKIKLNTTKSIYVFFSLCSHAFSTVWPDRKVIPTYHAQYLCIHLHSKLTWKYHIHMKYMYWKFDFTSYSGLFVLETSVTTNICSMWLSSDQFRLKRIRSGAQ